MAVRMFEDRKKEMMDAKSYLRPGDENSKYYTKPDEAPISHPAEVLERLQKEEPDTPMEELVKRADEIVKKEIEERRLQREAEAEAEAEVEEGEIVESQESSTEAKIEETKEDGEEEVSSA